MTSAEAFWASKRTVLRRAHYPSAKRFLLSDCEKTIEAGLKVFYEVGRALLTIRDLKLSPSEICGPPDSSKVESLGGHGDDMEWLASLSDKGRV